MKRRISVSTYVIFALFAIGIIVWFLANPVRNIIPVAVFGIVYLLYKFPPGRLSKPQAKGSFPGARTKAKRKPAPFRVIQGSKANDDETPKYH